MCPLLRITAPRSRALSAKIICKKGIVLMEKGANLLMDLRS